MYMFIQAFLIQAALTLTAQVLKVCLATGTTDQLRLNET